MIVTTKHSTIAATTDDSCAGHAEEPSLALVTRRPWRVTVRRMNHPFPPLFDDIGSVGCRECRTIGLREP
jgi:hypothetical protein